MNRKEFEYVSDQATQTGTNHQLQGLENQDSTAIISENNMTLVIVNDGCSGCEYPREAAELNVSTAKKLLQMPTVFSMNQKEFVRLMSELYLEAFSECGYPVNQTSATTAFVLIHQKTNRFIAFSVGDSAILTCTDRLQFRPLLEPLNGSRKSITCFTNSDYLTKVACFESGRISAGTAGFLVYSDGAEMLADSPFSEAQQLAAAALISKEAGRKTAAAVMEQIVDSSADDISFAFIMAKNDRIMDAAAALYHGEPEEAAAEPPQEETADTDSSKTKPVQPPFPKQKEESSQVYSPILHYLRSPRTAAELIQHGLCTNENLCDTLLVLLRLGIIRASQTDGKIVFQA